MIKSILLSVILFVLAFTINAQNDTMYVMKNGVVTYAISIKSTDVDSVIFYQPTTEETRSGTFTDTHDKTVYNWVKIGNQVWMAENLAYLPSVNQVADGSEDAAGSYYYVYGYDGADVNTAKATSNYTTYGVLYNWTAAMASSASTTANPSRIQGVCPRGWHLPSNDEWKELEMALGMSQADAADVGWRGTNEGSKLAGNAGLWLDGALESDANFGTSGFTALPGGRRNFDGAFYTIGYRAYWWGATESSAIDAWYRTTITAMSTVTSFLRCWGFLFVV